VKDTVKDRNEQVNVFFLNYWLTGVIIKHVVVVVVFDPYAEQLLCSNQSETPCCLNSGNG